jgi:hypothetical protein
MATASAFGETCFCTQSMDKQGDVADGAGG